MKQEHRQRGGFIRIFPTEDTFEFFSNFFQQRKTSFNKIVHQHFYPSRWTTHSLRYQENSKQIRRQNIPRAKYLSSTFQLFNKDIQNKTNASDLHHAIQRYQLYEKRLYSTTTNIIYPHKVIYFSFSFRSIIYHKRSGYLRVVTSYRSLRTSSTH